MSGPNHLHATRTFAGRLSKMKPGHHNRCKRAALSASRLAAASAACALAAVLLPRNSLKGCSGVKFQDDCTHSRLNCRASSTAMQRCRPFSSRNNGSGYSGHTSTSPVAMLVGKATTATTWSEKPRRKIKLVGDATTWSGKPRPELRF